LERRSLRIDVRVIAIYGVIDDLNLGVVRIAVVKSIFIA
jgi:hypothetical protein